MEKCLYSVHDTPGSSMRQRDLTFMETELPGFMHMTHRNPLAGGPSLVGSYASSRVISGENWESITREVQQVNDTEQVIRSEDWGTEPREDRHAAMQAQVRMQAVGRGTHGVREGLLTRLIAGRSVVGGGWWVVCQVEVYRVVVHQSILIGPVEGNIRSSSSVHSLPAVVDCTPIRQHRVWRCMYM